MNPVEPTDKIGILLVNLGTPEAPTTSAVRAWLRNFLSDKRVVELPAILWRPILYGLILPVYAGKAAKRYQSIWHEDTGAEGSPLFHFTQALATKLRDAFLHPTGHAHVHVAFAMRYGKVSIQSALQKMQADGINRFLILPLYPQYSMSTTASVLDATTAWTATARHIPHLRFISDYHAAPAYITALADSIRNYWAKNGRSHVLMMSFHGLPQRAVDAGDPYKKQCEHTAHLLARELDLQPEQWELAYQSRFGKARWITPETENRLQQLAASGTVKTVDVVCPGFACDCIETLQEIAIEAKESFIAAGGDDLRYIPALNDQPLWVEALEKIVSLQIADWLRLPSLEKTNP